MSSFIVTIVSRSGIFELYGLPTKYLFKIIMGAKILLIRILNTTIGWTKAGHHKDRTG